ncbi:hypothetical protein CIL05_07630 [Virgibacillus profundi]|uniref:Uncharacterized protein n=1 Tax=Virgibacillus profundi TaxID=2024555 RepID=A0A2A2IFK8_9BACI|nr:hypothetical protein [Virgibacillus profundi]PAV30332.1 hypothetical protein CIL05_07630 [Virgibacillus profundi]PXY54504.1 hypothetical protein CIT14_07715 [Virgibacillus profundi]
MYSSEDVQKATSFTLITGVGFNEDTRLHKVYDLCELSNGGEVVHKDDKGYTWLHAYNDELTNEAKCAIQSGAIIYHIPDEEPTKADDEINTTQINTFHINQIDKVHHSDPLLFELTVRTDAAGKALLDSIQTEIEANGELETLHKQREVIDERIDELQAKLRGY